jgi:NIMA (never in mitosis gene a)-related kinase
LDHPNIVSHKHTFFDQSRSECGVLIIIMEFCEYGDLAYHIKKKSKAGAKFSETDIMNWFVQLCLSLEYVHSRKILHRDLKTNNVFLTAENNVKLGDFGISKVLEKTHDHAMTVQGTPYYMSPEVCQNMPYTYQADIWALGVILYELCTLKRPFDTNNLLGLVFKIVQETPEPIGDGYSEEMQVLINILMEKDEKKRPRIMEIIRLPFVQSHMERYAKTCGKVNVNPNLKKRKAIQPEAAEELNRMKSANPEELKPEDQ